MPEPYFMAGPGFVRRWGDEVAMVTGNALVKVDPTRTDAIIDELNATIDPTFQAGRIADQDDFEARVNETIGVEVTVLGIFAAAAASPAWWSPGKPSPAPLGRSGPDQREPGRARGQTPRCRVLGAAATLAPAIAIGALGSVVLALVLSPLFPRGLARSAEPDLGVWLDPIVLLVGVVGLALLLGGVAVVVSWRAAPASGVARLGRGRPRRRSPGSSRSFPPVPALGTRFALQPDRRRRTMRWLGRRGRRRGARRRLRGGGHGRAFARPGSSPTAACSGPIGTCKWDSRTARRIETRPCEQLVEDPDSEAVATRAVLLGNGGEIEVRSSSGSTTASPVSLVAQKGAFPPIVSAGRPPGPGEVVIGDGHRPAPRRVDRRCRGGRRLQWRRAPPGHGMGRQPGERRPRSRVRRHPRHAGGDGPAGLPPRRCRR